MKLLLLALIVGQLQIGQSTYLHPTQRHSDLASVDSFIQSNRREKGILDHKYLAGILNARSKLYSETLHSSDIVPGQVKAVEFAFSHHNLLSKPYSRWIAEVADEDESGITLALEAAEIVASELPSSTPSINFDKEFAVEDEVSVEEVPELGSDAESQTAVSSPSEAATVGDVLLEIQNSSAKEADMEIFEQAVPLAVTVEVLQEQSSLVNNSLAVANDDVDTMPLEPPSFLLQVFDLIVVPTDDTTMESGYLFSIFSDKSNNGVAEESAEDEDDEEEVEMIDLDEFEPFQDIETPLAELPPVFEFQPFDLESELLTELNQEQRADDVAQSNNITVEYEEDEGVTAVVRLLHVQLVLGWTLLVLTLAAVLIWRLSVYIATVYPVHLLSWLEAECHTLFSNRNFDRLHSVLRWYLPQIEWYFGMHTLDTLTLLHYLARAQMAVNDFPQSRSSLQRLLELRQRFGEDAQLASIYEDLGFVLHALGDHAGALQCLHHSLRIMSEESAFAVDSARKSLGGDSHNSLADEDLSSTRDLSSWPEVADQTSYMDELARLNSSNASHSTVVLDSKSPSRLHSQAAALQLSSTGSLSPSTLDLNDVFLAHSDLVTAMKELDSRLQDHPHDQPVGEFDDLFIAPTVDMLRVTKKLAEVYRDAQDLTQSRSYFTAACSLVQRLHEQREHEVLMQGETAVAADVDLSAVMDGLQVELEGVVESLKQQQGSVHNSSTMSAHPFQYKQFRMM